MEDEGHLTAQDFLKGQNINGAVRHDDFRLQHFCLVTSSLTVCRIPYANATEFLGGFILMIEVKYMCVHSMWLGH